MEGQDHYEKLGLMVGLELHQQLDTERKLYCHCSPVVRDDEPDGGFVRRLRPTQSEMGEIDPAALFEFKKKKRFYYEYYNDTTCLVEADEEPPHNMDEESIDICITMATFLDSRIVDEVHPMRKIVIDGSNTSGFQRTAIVATGGKIDVGEKTIGIQTICLEEDAARKIEDKDRENMRVYRLDRLGIPLIEIATAPDIRTPDEAQEVALVLGLLLRSTGRVKRGLGTIRQDVNVSIKNGAIIEIKGLQQLDMLSTVVEFEAIRQQRLLEISDILIERGVTADRVSSEPIDVSHLFKDSESKVIKKTLKKDGAVFAVRLQGFSGLVGKEVQPGRRLGTEMADHARFWSGVGGLFHTDELPKYGITEKDVSNLRNAVTASEQDAVIIVAADKEMCFDALNAVVNRAKQAIEGVPAETRVPLPDGTSKYARPRPGAERMYPETDVRAVKITISRLKRIKKNMPETFEKKEKRFIEEHGLSKELASQIVRSLNLPVFEHLVEHLEVSPTLVAVTLENTVVSLNRDGVPTERIMDEHFHILFEAITEGKVSSEAISTILTYFAENPSDSIDDAIAAAGLGTVETGEIEEMVRKLVTERIDFVKNQGMDAIGGLMGVLMKELRGKVDGKVVKELLSREIQKVIDSQ